MKVRWPPEPLGLGTPLNLALLSPETRSRLARRWWLAPVVGLAAALVDVAVDHVFFGGETMRRTPDLGAHPPVINRVAVTTIGSIGEELFFRVGVATVVAWAVYWILRRVLADPRSVAQWSGILVAATWSGLWHVGMVGNPADFWRVMTINLIGSIVYGWFYWRRGFELAVLAHITLNTALYVGVPALR